MTACAGGELLAKHVTGDALPSYAQPLAPIASMTHTIWMPSREPPTQARCSEVRPHPTEVFRRATRFSKTR